MAASQKTPRSTAKLSEVARHVVIPDGIVTTGYPAVESKLKQLGVEFTEWQRGLGQICLGKRADGKHAATVGGIVLSIPRQVGKTFFVGMVIIALCLLNPGLTVLWSAHRTKTANKTFGSMKGYTSRTKIKPLMLKPRSVNGEQEIRFRNGSVIMFGAREGGFGRGFDEVDIEVFDEAQILTEKALEDMVAATNQSRWVPGALLFFMGTPPRPVDPGEEFSLRRKDALSGAAKDMVYVELGADPGCDPDDRGQWAKANPSFPDLTPLESMLRLRANLKSLQSWLREGLGIWDEASIPRVISEELWKSSGRGVLLVNGKAFIGGNPADGVRSFGIAYSRDGDRVAIVGALKHDNGVHVEIVDQFSGVVEQSVTQLADWLTERWQDTAMIAVCGAAGESLIQALRDRKVPKPVMRFVSTSEYKAACSMSLDALIDGSLTHTIDGQEALDLSVEVADKKVRGDGWGIESTADSGDEVPTEAMCIAYWAARTSKRVPGRKAKVRVM